MHPQFHAGDVCTSSAGVADIFKRRLLRFVLTFRNVASFKILSELSNGRCPTGYRLSLLCQCWYVFCVYAYAHTRTLNYVAREYIYIRRGLRVVGSIRLGNATASERGTTTVGSTLLFLSI